MTWLTVKRLHTPSARSEIVGRSRNLGRQSMAVGVAVKRKTSETRSCRRREKRFSESGTSGASDRFRFARQTWTDCTGARGRLSCHRAGGRGLRHRRVGGVPLHSALGRDSHAPGRDGRRDQPVAVAARRFGGGLLPAQGRRCPAAASGTRITNDSACADCCFSLLPRRFKISIEAEGKDMEQVSVEEAGQKLKELLGRVADALLYMAS